MPQASGGLIRCGRCGKHYTNPFTHICTTRIGAKRKGRTKLAPRLTAPAVKCSTCGKPYSNPLTHTCTTKTDFAKRKKAAGAKPKHPEPEDCDDGQNCQAYGCRMFWRGYALGHGTGFGAGQAQGHAEGYAEGHNDGHSEGFSEGYAAGAASDSDSAA